MKKENFTARNCDFNFNFQYSSEKLLVMFLNGVKSCLQHLTTYLYYSKYLFFAHRSSEYFSLCVFMLWERINLRKTG